MKRYHINVFAGCDDFPISTYVTDSSETASTCVARLIIAADVSRIEVLDSTQTLPLLVTTPQDLDVA